MVEKAAGGTLFLDEIGDLSMEAQSKLLRFLEDGEYYRIGGTEKLNVKTRVVSATNRNLEEMIRDERFRQDLYYRINIVKIIIPPLRTRLEDIPLLVDHFIGKFNRLRGKTIINVSPRTLAILMKHDYPGNVRELENIIEHAFILCPQGMIEPRHLPEYLLPLDQKEYLPSSPFLSFKEVEADFIRAVMEKNDWNRGVAARELGIHKTTLFRKMKSLGIVLSKGVD